MRNDVETALKKLDAYVRAVGMIDSDFGMNNEYGSPDMEILEAILTGTKLR